MLQQQGQLLATESLVPSVEATLHLLENRLDVLLGAVPDGLPRVQESENLPAVAGSVGQGVSSDLLLSRPDLRALRAELVSADAQFAQAVAERLPVVTLDSTFGFSGGSGSSGFPASIVLGALQPLIDWGLREAEVDRAQARKVEVLLAYSEAYLNALSEVDNALYQLRTQEALVELLKRRVSVLSETVEEAKRRYTAGLTDYLPVLDAQQQLQFVEREVLRQTREQVLFLVRFQVALGGGALPQYAQPALAASFGDETASAPPAGDSEQGEKAETRVAR
ncbi:MAG: TolC family protein [Bdellovibrionales bacterium]|nr:TolC family protein [Bdellovibrionales bacterium]